MVKVLAWYDNEWGYSNRLVDTTLFAGGQVVKARRAAKKSPAKKAPAKKAAAKAVKK